MPQSKAFDVQDNVRLPWRRYLDHLEPIRPALHRYCMSLTGNVWDGEDLLQDAIVRVFSLLGKHDDALKNPRAYLIRTATNLWIDRVRRIARERANLELELPEIQTSPSDKRDEVEAAANKLFRDLSPKERAAILMRDVLDLSTEESASLLQTSAGAIKASLNRGRERLSERRPAFTQNTPPRDMIDAFLEALQTVNIDAMRALCSEDLTGDLVGGVESNSFEQTKPVFEHAHMVLPELGFGENPWWEIIEYEGELMVAGYRTLDGIEGLNEIHRIEVVNGKIVRLRVYCFCPDTLRVVADHLGKPIVERPLSPYRSPS